MARTDWHVNSESTRRSGSLLVGRRLYGLLDRANRHRARRSGCARLVQNVNTCDISYRAGCFRADARPLSPARAGLNARGGSQMTDRVLPYLWYPLFLGGAVAAFGA